MPLDIIVGAQWGDEGKGRIVDLLSNQAEYIARYNGGDNAGHTVTVANHTFKLHLVPSGMIQLHTVGIIGNGVVINPSTLLDELDMLRDAGLNVSPNRLRISHAAHLITPAHRALDAAQEAQRGAKKIGTTLRGIGPAYTDKVTRSGIRIGEILDKERFESRLLGHLEFTNQRLVEQYQAEPLDVTKTAREFFEQVQQLTVYIDDTSAVLSNALRNGKRVLAEGAQGTLLDLDHGTYPFVTSSSTCASGAFSGLGIGASYMGRIVGVTKVFQTRVGAGHFPTEVEGPLAVRLRGTGENPWDEYGTTTGRPRRVGWLDMVLLGYAVRVNGLTELALTKLDILSGLEKILICTRYKDARGEYAIPPYGLNQIDHYQPVYEELAGWETDVRNARQWEDLPAQARAYILKIEEFTGIPVRIVSVGPERSQVVEIT